jgi:thymidine kinase
MGGMFSGKSTELIRRVKRRNIINNSILVINSSKDTRSLENVVRTHDSQTFDCVKTATLSDVSIEKYDVIAIDEAQFFTGLRTFVEFALGHDKHIILAGLDGDFKQMKFGELFDVIPLANDVLKLCALCMDCKDGTLGPFTKRCLNDDDTQQELIGGNEIYKAVCRKCLK